MVVAGRSLLLLALVALPGAWALPSLAEPGEEGVADGAAAGLADSGRKDALAPRPPPPAPGDLGAGFPPPRAVSLAPGDKELEFVCASPADGSFEYLTAQLHVIYTCPIRIYDNTIGGNTGWLFGNIRLVVDDADPSKSAFLTLHGGPTTDGPNDYSREGLTHSAFTTTQMGLDWTDSWTGGGYPHDGAYGEWATGTFDPSGNLYIGYLWSVGPAHGDSLFRVFKMPGVETAYEYMERYNDAWHDVEGRGAGNVIDEPQLVYVPARTEPVNATGPQEPGEVGDDTLGIVDQGTVVATWREAARNASASPTGMSAWIDMQWTHTGANTSGEDWQSLDDRQLVGPCRDTSNPVVWDHRVFVACTVDRGYDARGRAKVGDVDVWSFDPRTGNTTWVASTGVNGDHPRLAATTDGYFALATSRFVSEQQVEVSLSYGWHGRGWSPADKLGPSLHSAMGGHPMKDAHVTALEIVDDSYTAFVVYKEWNDVDETRQQPDPEDLDALRLTDYKKFVFSSNDCDAFIAGAEIVLGSSPDVYQQDGAAENSGAFNDQQDGLDRVRMPDGEEWVFFSISDYGAAQFGAIRGPSGASDDPCPVGVPIPTTPTPLAPVAATVPNPYGNLLGAMVGVVAVAMVGYLLAAKRRTADRLAAKAKK